MGTLDIGSSGNTPKAQSQNVYTVTRKTREEMERAIRENYNLLDEQECGQNYGAFPLGYAPINTIR